MQPPRGGPATQPCSAIIHRLLHTCQHSLASCGFACPRLCCGCYHFHAITLRGHGARCVEFGDEIIKWLFLPCRPTHSQLRWAAAPSPSDRCAVVDAPAAALAEPWEASLWNDLGPWRYRGLHASLSMLSSSMPHQLLLLQVVILGGICEFLGAVLLGAGVTSTIKSGVADIKLFQDTPQLLM